MPHFFQNLAEAEYLVTVYQCAPPPTPCLAMAPFVPTSGLQAAPISAGASADTGVAASEGGEHSLPQQQTCHEDRPGTKSGWAAKTA